ncbi:hypothetical protein [Microvirga sp. G4-2]|uniref:hypothetical protein n=1 Tax=Microvirga sp. G4-2 TaxID=3434467 RepID=UPI004044F0BD
MRARIEVRPATAEDISAIVANIREADRRECLAQTMLPPADALAATMNSALRAWVGLVDGVPACLFGVSRSSTLTPEWGRPWLVGTPLLERHERAFLRRNKAYISEFISIAPKLENWVDMRNEKAVRWLAWLGFKIHDAEPHGPLGRLFHRFTMGV